MKTNFITNNEEIKKGLLDLVYINISIIFI